MSKASSKLLYVLVTYLLIVLLAATAAWANPTTAEQAQTVAMNWLSLEAQPLGSPLGGQVKQVQTFTDDTGNPLYYVVYLDPAGLVLVPADDLVEPIIGFVSGATSYDPSPANPLGALASRDITGRVLQARELQAGARSRAAPLEPESPQAVAQSKWLWLAGLAASPGSGAGLPDISDKRVVPFVESKWSQSTVASAACYNYYTPPKAPGSADNYVCGCGATAMAQLMRYWQYPTAGIGVHSFEIWVNGVSQSRNTRGGDGAGGPYSWVSMVLDPSHSGVNVTQRQAIGALTHDAGVAANAEYSASGTSTYFNKLVDALVSTFSYSNARTGCNPYTWVNIPATNRNAMVNPNLHAKKPVIFLVNGPDGGHFIVCDGYGYNASTMYHHLNMGWGGLDDAWYNLPIIEAYYNYDSVTGCCYNVYLTGSGEIIAGRVTDSGGSPINGASVTGVRQGGGTYHTTTDLKGVYALAGVPSASTYLVSVTKGGYNFLPQTVMTGTSNDNSFTTGNLWQVDFTAGAGSKPDMTGALDILLLN
jgi:hypothetical protein